MAGEQAGLTNSAYAHEKYVHGRIIIKKYRQLELSMVDCVSFAVMQELGIKDVLTFDSDFMKAGFTVLPQ